MGFSRIWLLLALFAVYTHAVPLSNVTVTKYGSKPGLQATFGAEPSGRGTVSILISCTSTFIFCIWTAVHPNIVPGVSSRQRLYYKAILMFTSIMVPEGVLVCAFGQWRDARRLVRAWKECGAIKDKKKMTMQMAFFVVMGGFYIDEASDPSPGDNTTRKHRDRLRSILGRKKKTFERPYRAILTPTGFRGYLSEGLIHEDSFDNNSIIDKGKASTLAKVLAGIQALYLVVECASRWYWALPLTLLEVHVLIQVMRTALIYGFWWCKPLDVNEPIRLHLRKKGTAPLEDPPAVPAVLVLEPADEPTGEQETEQIESSTELTSEIAG